MDLVFLFGFISELEEDEYDQSITSTAGSSGGEAVRAVQKKTAYEKIDLSTLYSEL